MPDYVMLMFSHKAFISLMIVAGLLTIRWLLLRVIRDTSGVLSEQQLRWISYTKNGAIIFILLPLITLWWPEIRQFAFSIAAVAVALVIAAKELILCFSGAVLRTTSGACSVGDWIEIGDYRGEVIEQNLLSTVLQEVDQDTGSYSYTGKTITLPNSIFLSQSVKNMNFMRRFVFHTFLINTEPDVNVFNAKQMILEKLQAYSSEFMDIGRRYHAIIVKRSGMDIPSPEPSVRIKTTNLGKNSFVVSVFCPTPQATEIEQKITKDFFEFYYKNKPKNARSSSENGSQI